MNPKVTAELRHVYERLRAIPLPGPREMFGVDGAGYGRVWSTAGYWRASVTTCLGRDRSATANGAGATPEAALAELAWVLGVEGEE